MDDAAPSRNPLSQRDVSLLIGVVATLEGELLSHERSVHDGRVGERSSEFYDHLLDHLARRLERDGALGSGPTGQAVRQALSDLCGRLHYAWGAYDEPPASDPVPHFPPPEE